MMRHRIPVAAAVSTLLVVSSGSFGQLNEAGPLKTSLCELKNHPERFNGKLIQVRAAVVSSMETGGLRDEACSAWIYLSYASENYLSGHLGDSYAFVPMIRDPKDPHQLIWDPGFRKPDRWDAAHPSGLRWTTIAAPLPVVFVEDDSSRRLDEYVGKKFTLPDGRRCWSCPLYAIVASFIGRFDHSDTPLVAIRSKTTGRVSYVPAGFGHLNAALSQMVVQSVTDVVATPIDPSVYAKNP